jgi:hypothetical protein
VAQTTSSGIEIFPQGPQSPSTPTPTYAALISLESTQTQLVVQVPESDVQRIHTGEHAEASLPAVPESTMEAAVTQIEPTPVTESGQTYFLVDLSVVGPQHGGHDPKGGHVPSPTPQAGLTVDVSF